MPEITGYAFPNDIHVHWSLMIVMYPYITGFVAGSFIVTSLHHLFGKKEFEPVARLALGASFCFLLVAALPLQPAAWLLRGLVFQFLGLTSVGAYLKVYRRMRSDLIHDDRLQQIPFAHRPAAS